MKTGCGLPDRDTPKIDLLSHSNKPHYRRHDFNATVGNCFSGDLKGFFLSIKQLMTLPDNTRILPERLLRDSLRVRQTPEPQNQDMSNTVNPRDTDFSLSTLAEERRVNPYLRFNEETILK